MKENENGRNTATPGGRQNAEGRSLDRKVSSLGTCVYSEVDTTDSVLRGVLFMIAEDAGYERGKSYTNRKEQQEKRRH